MRPSASRLLLLSAALLLAGPALARAAGEPPADPAASPGAARAGAAAGILPGDDLDHPPPGTREDQSLWRSGFEVTSAVHLERARAGRLQAVLVNLRISPRLDLLAARPGEDGERGVSLRRSLSDAYAVQYSVLTARWPVETYRVCGYPAMEFGSMLNYGKAEAADLARHRAMLVGCVDQAQTSVKRMKEANDALQAVIAGADAALAAAGLGPAATGAPAQASAAAAPVGADRPELALER